MTIAIITLPMDDRAQHDWQRFFVVANEVRQADPGCPRVDVDLEKFGLAMDAPFFSNGQAAAFLAIRDGQAVGRIVAAHDRRHADGMIGFFDCVSDQAVADALLSQALAVLSSWGCAQVIGPVQLHALGGYRFQVEGFERKPFVGEPRNPRWMPSLLEGHGFVRSGMWRTWDFGGFKLRLFMALHRVQAWRNRRLRHRGYWTRELDRERFANELALLWPLVMECYAGAPAFWPLSCEEYVRWNLPLLRIPGARGVLVMQGDHDNPIGFGFGINEDPLYTLHSFGVAKQQRGQGLGQLMYEYAMVELKRLRATMVVGALAKEGTTKYDDAGGKPSRRYALYGRSTAPTP